MNTTGRECVGACSPEFLFASSEYPVSIALKAIAFGQGVLKRGTALAINADGKCVILGTENATAAYILAEDINTTETDATAEVYRTGHFIKNALAVKADYAITDTDVEEFRKVGIILDNGIL